MNKVGPSDLLRDIDERSRVDHPAAELHSERVWRIVRGGTIAWLRYMPPAGEPWNLYYDGTDAEGRQAWCRSFTSSSSAAAWAVQHADDLARTRRGLGPSRIV